MYIKKIFFLLIAVPLFSSQVWGDFHISPTVSVREEYNDNIYLERDEESDFITYIQPVFTVDWNTRLADLSLNMGLDYEKYWNNSDEDDLRPSQGSSLESRFNLYKDIFLLEISDSYERVTIDDGGKGGVGNNLVNLTDSNKLTINPYMLFQPSRDLQARIEYTYVNDWYRESEGDDAETHTYTAMLNYQLSPRISTNVVYGYEQYRPRDVSHSAADNSGEEEYDRNSVSMGVSWQVNEQMLISANAGRTWLYYDFSDDYATDMYGGEIAYQLNSAVAVGADYQDDISASVDEGVRDKRKYSAYVSYAKRYKAKLSVFQSRDKYLELKRRDDSWGLNLDGEVPLNVKQGIVWLLNYSDYSEGHLQDYERYGAKVEFYHQLRLGRMSLGYTYNENDSTIRDNDYTNNIVFIKMTLRW